MKLGFFTDAIGMPSSTRVMAFELVNAGILIGVYAVATMQLDMNTIGFCIALITLGFTGKLIQKPFENNANNKASTPPTS